jgi:hypothetical protein
MEESYSSGFNVEKLLIEVLKLLKERGVLEESEILEVLWNAKDPYFPWDKQDIKELIKL